MASDDDKEKALEMTVDAIEKEFGKGAIMRLGDDDYGVEVDDPIPSGSISLDIALGIGGYPPGRIIEVFGPEGSGKTTLALHALANAQRQGGVAAFVDAEHALDVPYARSLGVDTEELLVSQPDTGEQALEIVDMLVRSNAVDILVVDSVAALTPRAEIEGEMGDSHVGLQARLMSQAMRKLAGSISKSRTCVMFINQIRMKIGVMFGSPETTSGGRALKFYCSQRLDIRRTGAIKDGSDVIGNETRVKVVKNKLAPPFKEAEFELIYGEGISHEGDLLNIGTDLNIIERAGSWYSYGEEKLGQGRANAKEFLREHPEMRDEIEQKIRDHYDLPSIERETDGAEDGEETAEAAE
ncbi:MAG: recombinase RecA [Bradymonadaceae bacterium]